MSSTFDPYYKWLAIPPAEQPPNHYRLLAVNLFESDADVIATAADQRMAHVRSFQSGQYVDASQRLLNQLATARLCLLRADKKAAYDAALREKLAAQTARMASPAPPPPPPPVVAAPMAPSPFAAAPMVTPQPSLAPLPAPAKFVAEMAPPADSVNATAAPAPYVQPTTDWHDEIDPLGLANSAGRYPKRTTVSRPKKTSVPKVFLLPPLAGIAIVAVTLAYNNLSDLATQQTSNAEHGKVEKTVKHPGENVYHPGALTGKTGHGSPQSNSNLSQPPSATDDVASIAPAGGPDSAVTGNSGADNSMPLSHPENKPAAPARCPVPDAEAQRKSLVEIRKVYKDEFAKATSIESRDALAKKLGKLALDTKEDPTTRYVLATQALEIAVKLGDAKLASDLVSGFSVNYDIDAWELKAKTLSQLAAAAKTPEARRLIADGAFDLVDKAIVDERYDVAVQIASSAADLASTLRDPAFREKTREGHARAMRMQQEAAAVQAAQERLALHSDDAAAHLFIGRFFCLEKQDWDSGLPHLVRGSDSELSALARQEMAGAAQPADQVILADAWWEMADHRRDAGDAPLVKGMRDRAVYWYRRALPQLSGFAQSKAQKRIAEATPSPPAKP